MHLLLLIRISFSSYCEFSFAIAALTEGTLRQCRPEPRANKAGRGRKKQDPVYQIHSPAALGTIGFYSPCPNGTAIELANPVIGKAAPMPPKVPMLS